MLRCAKFAWLAVLLVGFQSAFGFALLGPINEPWQTTLIGYNLAGGDKTFGNGSSDIGAPKKIGQGYRRTTPVMYYALDDYFLRYFGSNGIVAIDRCYDIFNALPPVSKMSADLSEFPFEVTRVNPTAEALWLFDLKSTALAMMVENLGLAEPERYVWAMHDRYLPAGGVCPPDVEYLIVKRNYDPVTWEPSSYVNGTLYTYVIDELCAAPPPPVWRALCHPYPVDQDADTFTAVASGVFFLPGTIYQGLTRDDVGGLRYLLSSNNVAYEFPPTNSTTITTNLSQGQFLVTSNLTELAQLATTTNAATLQALIPGLVVTGTSNYWTQFYSTNLTLIGLRNDPFDPIGTPPHIPVYQTNVSINFAQRYVHTFGNLVTFTPTPGGWRTTPLTTLPPSGRAFVSLQTTTASASPWDPSGTLVTNRTTHFYLTNAPVGDYAVLPTNSCGVFVAASLFTNVYSTTNLLTSTNTVSLLTNSVSGSTNVAQFSQSLVQYFTNHFFWVYTADCGTNTPALRQGIEKISYFRRNFDSLLGRFFQPITNTYTAMVVTNYALMPQTVQRILTWPDFLFTTTDNTAGPGDIPSINAAGRDILFTQDPGFDPVIPAEPGPGTIEPSRANGPGTVFTFNSTAPIFANIGGVTGNEASGFPEWIWGSYDMSTNAPIVYPSGTSIKDLENMLLIQVTPNVLPEFTIGVDSNYNVQFQTQAATPDWVAPYSWALRPGSPGLPTGMDLSSDGLLSGAPTTTGEYNFVVRVTDATGRYVDRGYAIQVN